MIVEEIVVKVTGYPVSGIPIEEENEKSHKTESFLKWRFDFANERTTKGNSQEWKEIFRNKKYCRRTELFRKPEPLLRTIVST
jgi:hypothetical protein